MINLFHSKDLKMQNCVKPSEPHHSLLLSDLNVQDSATVLKTAFRTRYLEHLELFWHVKPKFGSLKILPSIGH